MKKIILLTVVLLAINIAFQAVIKDKETTSFLIYQTDIEGLSNTESSSADCISGGPGSSSCGLDGRLDVIEGSCSVSCSGDYWSCCALDGCHCRL